MRIGIDARTLVDPASGKVSGVPQFTSAIIQSLVDDSKGHAFVLFTDALGERVLYQMGFPSHTRPVTVRVVSGAGRVPVVSSHYAVAEQIDRERLDIFFAPTGHVPLGLKTPFVLFVHDLMIVDHPEWFPDNSLQRFFTLHYTLPSGIRRAKQVVVPSQFVKEQLARFLPGAEKKCVVIPEGVRVAALSHPHVVRYPRYIFSLATQEPRKNLCTAIRAFDQCLTAHPELVGRVHYQLAGARGKDSPAIKKLIEEINAKWRAQESEGVIHDLGVIGNAEKWSLYAYADALLFPSLAEGFGLPPFEAMAMGTPVMSTCVGAVGELAAGAIAPIVAHDPAAMAQTIADVLTNEELRQGLVKKGKNVVKGMSWQVTARKILAILSTYEKTDKMD